MLALWAAAACSELKPQVRVLYCNMEWSIKQGVAMPNNLFGTRGSRPPTDHQSPKLGPTVTVLWRL